MWYDKIIAYLFSCLIFPIKTKLIKQKHLTVIKNHRKVVRIYRKLKISSQRNQKKKRKHKLYFFLTDLSRFYLDCTIFFFFCFLINFILYQFFLISLHIFHSNIKIHGTNTLTLVYHFISTKYLISFSSVTRSFTLYSYFFNKFIFEYFAKL